MEMERTCIIKLETQKPRKNEKDHIKHKRIKNTKKLKFGSLNPQLRSKSFFDLYGYILFYVVIITYCATA